MRKRFWITGVVVICLLVVAALSRPGRAALTRIFSTEKNEATAESPTAQGEQDIEQRVRVRHGWDASLTNSVVTGEITYYDREGEVRGQASFTLHRKYPNKMRVVIERGGSSETMGFDENQTWRRGSRSLSETEARDIRAWLRLWPERLFSSRDRGASYKEAGQRVEEMRPASPWQGSARLDRAATMEQVEIADTISEASGERAADERSVYYYIDSESLLIKSARWMEPDDPRRGDDPTAARMDSRVDFGNWLQMGGVMWPMEIVRWLGGRVEFRIEVKEVKVNQPMADSLFNPDR
jgi:hypothetical protein